MKRNPGGNLVAPPFVFVLALSGCGGGGGGGGGGNPNPPADTTAPVTTISTTITSPTNSTAASIAFTSNEAGSTFEARLDGGAFATVTSPRALNALADGAHTFEVRARDAAGNVDATPASITWTVDATAPVVSIRFPTPVSYTDSATLTVRGTASDAGAIQGIQVNGVAAVSDNAFAAWRATVPIAAGNNTLTVSATDALGNTNASAGSVSVANRGPMILRTGGADFDPVTNRIIVTDIEKNSVYAYNATTGLGELIADFTLASSSSALAEGVVDAPNRRLLVVDWGQDALVAVGLDTESRSTLSQGTNTGPTQLSNAFGVAHDPAGNRVFVTARGIDSIIAIDLGTGARTVVSSPTVGTGTAFVNPVGIAYDAAGSRLLVGDATLSTPATIYAVDIATGNRTVYSRSPDTGTGPPIGAPVSLRLDAANNLLYVLDIVGDQLFSVDRATGDRTRIAGLGAGSGSTLDPHSGLAFDAASGRLFAAQHGGDILSIDTTTLARQSVLDARVGPGLRLLNPRTVVAEQASGAITSLLFGELEGLRITRLNLATSERTLVSGPARGMGPSLNQLADFVLDTRAPANGSAILALVNSPNASLMSVDIATGERTSLSLLDPTWQLRNLRLDAAGNRALYTRVDNIGNTTGLHSVHLGTLAQTAISTPTVGSGAPFSIPTTFVLEPANNPTRALLVDLNPTSWLAVDLTTGARSEFTTTSGGPALPLLGPLFYDGPSSAIYGLNIYPAHLFVTTFTPGGGETGRDLISGAPPGTFGVIGSGPQVDFASGLTVDTARGIAYAVDSTPGTIMAIDLVSGDRVVIAR